MDAKNDLIHLSLLQSKGIIMRLVIVLVILFLFMHSPVSSQDCQIPSGNPIRLGAVFPEKPLFLNQDGDALDAVQAVTQQYNQCSSISRPIEWQIVYANNYDDAIAAMAQFSADNIPLVIGGGLDSVSEGLNAGASQYEIVFWDVTERPRQLPSDWTFTLRPTDDELALSTSEFIQRDVVTQLTTPLRLALVNGCISS